MPYPACRKINAAGPTRHTDGVTTATVVGSGPNGLAAALTLAAAGVDVTVLEAPDRLGGGAQSSELTLPGLVHDDCSAIHPLAVGSAFAHEFDLTAAGLVWRWPEVQFSHPLDGGRGGRSGGRSTPPQRASEATGAPGSGSSARWPSGSTGSRPDILQPVVHLPRHPIHLARFGAYAALPVPALARRWATPEAGACSPAPRHTPSGRSPASCPRRSRSPWAHRRTPSAGPSPRAARVRSAGR